jgi:hypothetical protein
MPKIEQQNTHDRRMPDRLALAWDAWFCRNRRCPQTVWLAQRRPGEPETWLIARSEQARPWVMDGKRPACPHCCEALSPALDLVCAEID